jgi:hypothetical protein
MTSVEPVLSWLMLSGLIWVAGFLFPKAVRERNVFGLICSILAALVSVIGWLLVGSAAHSR